MPNQYRSSIFRPGQVFTKIRDWVRLHLLNGRAVQCWLCLQTSSTSCLQVQSCPSPVEQHHLRAAVYSSATAGTKERHLGSGTGSDVFRREQGDDFCGPAFQLAQILYIVSLRILEISVLRHCMMQPGVK
jgi:hypothetical protein